MLGKMKNLLGEEEGQGLSEYGLILAGVVVVSVSATALLTGSITTLFGKLETAIKSAMP
ncbi:Flp family type IVb pilin [Neobacillus drentensis]|uniref:Flp family type IVb pilin n=1 Tax=Neobacillus drentensis TaxID=220684 RepID=UPI002FFDFD5E